MIEVQSDELEVGRTYVLETAVKPENGRCNHPVIDTMRLIAIDEPFVICKSLYQERVILRRQDFKWYEPSETFLEMVRE